MLPVRSNHIFTGPGLFAAKRKYDIHTGLDIYCEEESPVISLMAGTVTEVIPFTGVAAGSPWWNETEAIAVIAKNGVTWVYGEVTPCVKQGDIIRPGQVIGKAKRVLKEDKGVNPPCMLHVEVWEHDYQSNYTWHHGEVKPKGLVNPLNYFCFWIIKTPSGYKLETHDGKYWKYFPSAVDCKAYCMSRHDEHREKYKYVNSDSMKKEYFWATGKRLQIEKF